MNKANYLRGISYNLSCEGLDFIQEQILTCAKSIAGALGTNSNGKELWIVAGCNYNTETSTMSAGVVSIDGELYNVASQENVTATYCRIVSSENQDPSRTTDTVVFGAKTSDSYTWAEFERIEAGVLATKTDVENLKNLAAPTGSIIMWEDSDNIPTGWALCDGQTVNGVTTPDLRGRFIVGYDHTRSGETHDVDNDYNAVGNNGGEKNHKLTVNEMPSHSHSITGQIMQKDGSSTKKVVAIDTNGDSSSGNMTYAAGTKIGSTGGGTAHENRPPYYVLCYIKKVA